MLFLSQSFLVTDLLGVIWFVYRFWVWSAQQLWSFACHTVPRDSYNASVPAHPRLFVPTVGYPINYRIDNFTTPREHYCLLKWKYRDISFEKIDELENKKKLCGFKVIIWFGNHTLIFCPVFIVSKSRWFACPLWLRLLHVL